MVSNPTVAALHAGMIAKLAAMQRLVDAGLADAEKADVTMFLAAVAKLLDGDEHFVYRLAECERGLRLGAA